MCRDLIRGYRFTRIGFKSRWIGFGLDGRGLSDGDSPVVVGQRRRAARARPPTVVRRCCDGERGSGDGGGLMGVIDGELQFL
jgi:hypothetical protein